MKCIKCGISRRGLSSNYVCEDCKIHEKIINKIYNDANRIFSQNKEIIENSDIYELLKNTFFIVQRNPKLSIYHNIVKCLLEDFAVKGLTEIDYDELWRETKSRRNIMKIIKSMEDADIIKMEVKETIKRVIKPSKILDNFVKIYRGYSTKQQAQMRVAAVLSMYAILHDLYNLSRANSEDEIISLFGPHVPRAAWVTTMFLWTKRVQEGDEFSEEDLRKFLTTRHLSAVTVSNYTSALRSTNPVSVQRYIDKTYPDNNGTIVFKVDRKIINTIERIYSEREREDVRD